jgi:hypothetical protein
MFEVDGHNLRMGTSAFIDPHFLFFLSVFFFFALSGEL